MSLRRCISYVLGQQSTYAETPLLVWLRQPAQQRSSRSRMPQCAYYNKKCWIIAPCCGETVCCHRCHDKNYGHQLPRSSLRTIECDNCNELQRISEGNICRSCGTCFAAYFCSKCGIANDCMPPQGYFHCDMCRICRVGSADEYFHCDICNCCLRIQLQGDHIHQPNCLYTNCPVCKKPMFDSQQPADKLPCGHMAHLTCISNSSTPSGNICRLCCGTAQCRSAAAESSSMAAQRNDSGSEELAGIMDTLSEGVNERELQERLQDLLLEYRPVLEAAPKDIKLGSHPRTFRVQLEKAVAAAILNTSAENEAKGRAIHQVVQLLQTCTSRFRALSLNGRAVTVDRVEVAGSVGQKVSVQGMFDIDIVAFINLPSAGVRYTGSRSSYSGSDKDIVINVADPDTTHYSGWMQELRLQLYDFLERQLPDAAELTLKPNAITFKLPTVGTEEDLEIDILLAPNLVTGDSSNRQLSQYKAVLAPLVLAAEFKISGSSSSNLTEQVIPSFSRSIWLAESYTTFCKDAAAGGGAHGQLVTTTTRLVKAWIRKSLQQQWQGFKNFKSFMVGLLVLEAAKTLTSGEVPSSAESRYQGRYVLDLLLSVLDVIQTWAAAAALSAAGEDVAPVFFTGMAHEEYYTERQAWALQEILQETSSRDSWKGACRGQPVVIHPVDPLCNVFNQRPPFQMWETFSQAAAELAGDLKYKSWEYICTHSLLAPALARM